MTRILRVLLVAALTLLMVPTASVAVESTSDVTVTCTIEGDQDAMGVYTSPVVITLDVAGAYDPDVQTLRWVIDDWPIQEYTGVIGTNINGTHTIQWWVDDPMLGTVAHGERTFTIDRLPPVAVVTLEGDQAPDGTYTSDVLVTVDVLASDYAGETWASVNLDGWYFDYTEPFWVGGEGVHEVSVQPSAELLGVGETITETFEIAFPRPTVTCTIEGDQDAAGVYTSPVTISLDVTGAYDPEVQTLHWAIDDWPVQEYTEPIMTNVNGEHVIRWWVDDPMLGTVAYGEQPFTIDLLPPVAVVTLQGDQAPDGTYTSDVLVTVDVLASDYAGDTHAYVNLDGYDFMYTEPFWVGGEGIHDLMVLPEAEFLGVGETVTETFEIAFPRPTVTCTIEGDQDAAGVYTSPVIITLDVTGAYDPEVQTLHWGIDDWPVQEYTGPICTNVNGTHTINWWIDDPILGVATWGEQTFTIDRLPPVAVVTLQGDQAPDGTYTSDVLVSVEVLASEYAGDTWATVNLDGQYFDYTEPFLVDGEGVHEVSVQPSAEFLGVGETVTETFEIRSATIPETYASLDGVAGDNGWYRSPVLVTLSTDDLGVYGPTEYTFDGVTWTLYTGPFLVSAEGATELGYRTWSAVGCEEAKSILIRIDTCAPVIDIALAEPTIFILGETGDVFSWTADDATSGVADASSVPEIGSVLDASAVGDHEVAVTATDMAGNTATVSSTYRVVYTFSGFLDPINADGSSVFKAGSTVPIKFRLTDFVGEPVCDAVATLMVTQLLNAPTGTFAESPVWLSGSEGTTFTCDASNGLYHFNLSTKGMAPGTYVVAVALDDGTVRSVRISLR